MARVNTVLRRNDLQEGKMVRTNFNGKSIVVAGKTVCRSVRRAAT